MSLGEWGLLILALGIVVSGVLLLKQSATKFHLSDEQWRKVKKRQQELQKEEDQDS